MTTILTREEALRDYKKWTADVSASGLSEYEYKDTPAGEKAREHFQRNSMGDTTPTALCEYQMQYGQKNNLSLMDMYNCKSCPFVTEQNPGGCASIPEHEPMKPMTQEWVDIVNKLV
jgi:hypothetical protein